MDIKVEADGSLILPIEARKRLGVEKGGKLMLHENDFGLRLTELPKDKKARGR